LPAKTIFARPVLTAENTGFSTNWQKLANPGSFCLCSAVGGRHQQS